MLNGTWRALLAASVLVSPALTHAQTYKDPDASVEARAKDLVSRMTLDEKARQMQDAAPAIPHLDLPAYDWWNEGLHGLARSGEATVFPQAIGMAATWDKGLLRAEGKVIGMEARARYNKAQREGNVDRYFGLTIWSPNINIFRDPRWGRGQETLGEDPYLTGTLATQYVLGLQGDDPKHFLAIATPKHFAVHSGPEPLRHQFNVNVAPQDLAETYLPAFRRTIIDGHAGSVMCAYNAVDDTPACGSKLLLTDTLRTAWGFTGFVTSDCGAIDDFVNGHKTKPDYATASAASIKAGTDTGCNFRNEYLAIPDAVKRGLLSEADVDKALIRLMSARIRLGMFDPPGSNPYAAIPPSEIHSRAHRDIALKAARESIVLLKNNGVLPLVGGKAKILVVGPAAVAREVLNGNYKGTAVDEVLPLDGIRNALDGNRIEFAQGSAFVPEIGVTVPRTVFGPGGVKARFWNGIGFAGPVVATRVEHEIDNDWNGISPAPGVKREAFSVEYSGTLNVPSDGTYEFGIGDRKCDWSDDHQTYVLSIEGEPDIRASGSCGQGIPLTTKPIAMKAGQPRKFRLAFTHYSPRLGAGLTLTWKPPTAALLDEAKAKASKADIIVALVGLTAGLEGEEMKVNASGFDGGDRTTIQLPEVQEHLLAAMEASGKPVIIVGLTGSSISYGSADDKAAAVLQAWYGGEAGGTAIGEVLAGAVNPSGRLPVTFYKSVDQLPPFDDYSMKGRTYRYFTGQPAYAFGHGLSYTQFAYSRLILSQHIRAGAPLNVRVDVTNSGKLAGEEVVQLYLQPQGQRRRPRRSLKGFARVHLEPGETKSVELHLSPRDLAFANVEGHMNETAGNYVVWVGGGQENTGAPGMSRSFEITGNKPFSR